jgi:hypothetical protein
VTKVVFLGAAAAVWSIACGGASWEPSLGILHTEEQSQYCGGCHLGAGSTDSVFIDGLRP